MPWEDNLQVDGTANRGWASTPLGTCAGGIAEGYWLKKEKGERNSSASPLRLPDKASSRLTKVYPAGPLPCPRIHLLVTTPHLLPKNDLK